MTSWEDIKPTYSAWWRHELERPIVQVWCPSRQGVAAFDYWSFVKCKDDLDSLSVAVNQLPETLEWYGDAYPSVFVNLGAGILATFFSGYFDYDAVNSTVWFEQPRSWEAVDAMRFQDNNEWWQYAQRVTDICAGIAKDRFPLGMTDIGGVMDILASLRGTQNLLMDLLTEPERVNRMRRRILDAWHVVHDNLAARIACVQEGTTSWFRLWCPETYAVLQCDFAAMISPDLFDAFVAPDIREHCVRLGHGIYHLDGPGQIAHVDSLLEIPELDGIQWVPGSRNPQCDDAQWYPMYRKILESGRLLVLHSFDDVWRIPQMLRVLPNQGLLFAVSLRDKNEAKEFLDLVSIQP